MRQADAIVVGGGPAGSTCAWKLRHAGLDVIVLDKAAFPRLKLCAGWVTPKVLRDLELAPEDYPHGLLTFETLRLHWGLLSISHAARQHSIRRTEFDAFLLERSGAEVFEHAVRDIRYEGGAYTVDGVMTEQGFRPTELNPRVGAAMGSQTHPLKKSWDLIVKILAAPSTVHHHDRVVIKRHVVVQDRSGGGALFILTVPALPLNEGPAKAPERG